ncbi:MAGa7180 family putative nuclease [Mycoplasma sp. 005V]|uniref:MAGa7180 family putative nuclease n=1 Tax=unclassified Mycoplasma TaxID=2683645 RepID=UPI003A8AFBCB
MPRKFFNKTDYFIDYDKQVLILSDHLYAKLHSNGQFDKYKKMGGSSIADILIKDAFKNEFSAFCHITRLKLPVLTQKYVHAGVVLEPRIFDYLRSKMPNVAIENYEAAAYNYDFFASDPIIGGVPDGYLPIKNMILEIKTAGEKKKELWAKEGVDPAYRKQAQLYSYLKGADSYSIVALFLRPEDYEHPENIDLSQRSLQTYAFKLNKQDALDDIAKIKNWYNFYTNTKISPRFDLSINADQLEYLECENFAQWEALLEKWKAQGKADPDIKA